MSVYRVYYREVEFKFIEIETEGDTNTAKAKASWLLDGKNISILGAEKLPESGPKPGEDKD